MSEGVFSVNFFHPTLDIKQLNSIYCVHTFISTSGHNKPLAMSLTNTVNGPRLIVNHLQMKSLHACSDIDVGLS